MLIRASRLAIATLLVISLAPLAGCIGAQSTAAREFDPFPPAGLATGDETNVALTVTFTASGVPATAELRQMQDAKIKVRATRLLNKTGAVRVALNPENAQYRLALAVNDRGGSAGALVAAFVSGFTLTVLPCWVTHEYTTVAELVGPSGKVVARRSDVHSLTYITQLFMVFGMPFSSVDKAHQKMWTAVLEDISVWTAEQVQRTRAAS